MHMKPAVVNSNAQQVSDREFEFILLTRLACSLTYLISQVLQNSLQGVSPVRVVGAITCQIMLNFSILFLRKNGATLKRQKCKDMV